MVLAVAYLQLPACFLGCEYLLFAWMCLIQSRQAVFLESLCNANGVSSNWFLQMKTMCGSLSVHTNSYISVSRIPNSLAWLSDCNETPGRHQMTLTWDLRFVLCHSLSQIMCDPHRDYNTKFKPSVIQLSDALPFYCLFYGKTGASSCDQFWLNIQIVRDSPVRRVAFTASLSTRLASSLPHR